MATMTKVESVLDALVDKIPALLAAAGYRADSCVRATRIACLALSEIGVMASPLPVLFSGYSPRYVEAVRRGELTLDGDPISQDLQDRLMAEGAWNLRIGDPETPARDGRYPGHLTTLVERRWVADTTIQQASRPTKQMTFEPHWFRVTPAFMAGDPATFSSGEAIGLYRRIENNTYLVSPDWAGVRRDDRMVRDFVRTLRGLR